MTNNNQESKNQREKITYNIIKILKWCIVGATIQDFFWLYLYHMTILSYQHFLQPNATLVELNKTEINDALTNLNQYFWVFHSIIGLHLILSFASCHLLNQRKWHWAIVAYALVSFFIMPIGPFIALILIAFLYAFKGRQYLN